jgi:hypothetical protein
MALAVPASAQGAYIGAGPGGVGVGVGPGYYDGYYGPRYRERYTRYDDDYAYAGECRVKVIRHDGHVTRIRRCD